MLKVLRRGWSILLIVLVWVAVFVFARISGVDIAEVGGIKPVAVFQGQVYRLLTNLGIITEGRVLFFAILWLFVLGLALTKVLKWWRFQIMYWVSGILVSIVACFVKEPDVLTFCVSGPLLSILGYMLVAVWISEHRQIGFFDRTYSIIVITLFFIELINSFNEGYSVGLSVVSIFIGGVFAVADSLYAKRAKRLQAAAVVAGITK